VSVLMAPRWKSRYGVGEVALVVGLLHALEVVLPGLISFDVNVAFTYFVRCFVLISTCTLFFSF